MSDLIRFLDLSNSKLSAEQIQRELPRASLDLDSAIEIIRPLVERIRTQGSKAIEAIAKEIDGIDISPIRVSQEELKEALANLNSELRAQLQTPRRLGPRPVGRRTSGPRSGPVGRFVDGVGKLTTVQTKAYRTAVAHSKRAANLDAPIQRR